MSPRREGYKKRKIYFIAPAFQLRYIRVILLIMFTVGALAAYAVYYQAMVLMGEKLANVYPQGRLVAIVKNVNIQILLTLLFITPLVVVIGLLISHKIAGPIYRMEKVLAAMAKGDISTRISLRKHDEMKSLADSINRVIDSLNNKIALEKKTTESLHKEITALEEYSRSARAEPGTLNSHIDRLKEEIGKMENALSQYALSGMPPK